MRRIHPRNVAIVLALAFIVALFLDIPLSTWAHTSGLAPWLERNRAVALTLRIPGNFGEYTLPVVAALIAAQLIQKTPRDAKFWVAPSIVLLAGVISGINAVLKICVGRIRPYHHVPPFEFHPFSKAMVDTEAGFSFPSGDASLAFAMAASLSMVAPRLWPLWWGLATVVGIERIAANAHYPSDVVAGVALGVGCACLARWFVLQCVRRVQNDGQEPIISS